MKLLNVFNSAFWIWSVESILPKNHCYTYVLLTPSCYKIWRNLPSLHVQYLPFSYHPIIFKQPTTWHLTDFEPDLRVPSIPITCLGGISNQVLKKESSERRCKIQQAIFQFHRSIQRLERVPTKAGAAMGSKTGNREIFGKQAFLKHCSVLL